MNIYPAVDILNGQAVRLRQGRKEDVTVYGRPLEMAQRWARAGAEWLHVVDLDGAFEGSPRNHASIAEIAAAIPGLKLQIGGGIVLPVHTDAGRVDFAIRGVRSAETPPEVPERRSSTSTVVATLEPIDDALSADVSVGARLNDADGAPLGVVIAAQPRSHQAGRSAMRLAVAVTCTPVGGGCKRGDEVIEPHAALSIRLPRGPAKLRVEAVQRSDMPVALAFDAGK